MIKLAPSLLASDYLRIGEELDSVKASGAEWLHFDVMDGMFVPNITFGQGLLKACASKGIFCDAHLMICDPDRYIDEFAAAGAGAITVHAEACGDLRATIQHIKDKGCVAGVALNPETPVSTIANVIDICDMILIMTVHPGFGAQKLIPECVGKIAEVSNMRHGTGPKYIEVDGGINADNAGGLVANGANVIVAGTAFFRAPDRKVFAEKIMNL